MNRKWYFFFVMLACISLLSGCWSQTELSELALVSAIGIDKTKDGRYIGTYQIISPGNVASGLQGGGGGQNPPVNVYAATGDNVLEMSRRVSRKVSRIMYYAHANLIVISDTLAKEEGLNTIFDALDRGAEFRDTATVVIAHHTKAGDIVKTLTNIDKIPANKVIKTLKFTQQQWGEQMNITIQDVVKSIISPGKEPVVSGFRLIGSVRRAKSQDTLKMSSPDEVLETDGLAIFKDGKLVDWFEGETARGVGWVLNKAKKTVVDIDWGGKKEALAYEVIRQNTKMSSRLKKGQPQISVHVRAEGDVGEIRVPVELTDPHVLLKVESALEKEIKKEIEESIQRAQKKKADIFGFGEALYRSEPKKWHQIKNHWTDKYFPNLQVNVTVDVFIRRTGLRNLPYFSNLKNNH